MKKINVLHVIPADEDYVYENITCDMNEIKNLVGGEVNYVKLTDTFGFYCKADINESDAENFSIMNDAEIIHEISGSVVFTRVFDDKVPTGMSEQDAEQLATNLVRTSWGRVLFLDRIEDMN